MPGAARIGDPFDCGDYIAEGSPDVLVNNIPLARLNDPTTGHGCWGANQLIEGASTVFINGIPASYLGHSNDTHCCVIPCHSGVVNEASMNVFIEGGDE